MKPSVRKLALIVHITASVGWIGVALAYIALVIIAMVNSTDQVLRMAWLSFSFIGWFALVPMSVLALITGLIMSLGTKWGLFRHYWVIISLVLTLFATIILVLHMQTVSSYANAAMDPNTDVIVLRSGLKSELFHAGVGSVVMLVVQALNVYKPRGVTPYGWRKQRERPSLSSTES